MVICETKGMTMEICMCLQQVIIVMQAVFHKYIPVISKLAAVKPTH